MKAKAKTRWERREEKKARVLEKKQNKTPYILAGVTLVLLASAAFFWVNVVQAPPAGSAQPGGTENAATQISYSLDLFEDGVARHFHYQDQERIIRYFILKSADGVIRAAFDACDVCWPANKGYFQDGDFMVCRNCGRRFASVRVNEVKGGCNPAPLRRTVENNRVILQVQDILEGNSYFTFS